MSVVFGRSLDRRTLLRGMGASLALPALDAMTPAFAEPQPSPLRLAFTYVPNGITPADWTPKGEGRDFELSRILKPLEPYRERIVVVSGLAHKNGNALGDGPGDHARAGGSFLTGVHPRKTAGADIHNGVSVDQVAARAVGDKTRLASLELGCEESRTVGNCDSGYSCAYTNSISWRSDTTPMPPETNPRMAFERLFGADDCPARRRGARAAPGRPPERSRRGARPCAGARARARALRSAQARRVPGRSARDRASDRARRNGLARGGGAVREALGLAGRVRRVRRS